MVARKNAVHPLYMLKAKAKKSSLRWRPNCIRFWRDFRDITLEGAAERLARPPYNLRYTHNSLGRVENAKQMPTIELIEALAKLYDTDIDSLLNRRPATANEASAPSANLLLHFWDRADTAERGLIINVAKRVVKTET